MNIKYKVYFPKILDILFDLMSTKDLYIGLSIFSKAPIEILIDKPDILCGCLGIPYEKYYFPYK